MKRNKKELMTIPSETNNDMLCVIDKNEIKNGMIFEQKNGDLFIRIGKYVVRFMIGSSTMALFKDVKQEDIKRIYKSNGELLVLWEDEEQAQ